MPAEGQGTGLPESDAELSADVMKTGVVYKRLTQTEWAAAVAAGITSTSLDVADGYVHLSTAAQVRETARRYFAGKGPVRLLGFDAGALESLRWGPSRNGELFPHVYGPLMISAAHLSLWLELDAAGVPVIPEDIA